MVASTQSMNEMVAGGEVIADAETRYTRRGSPVANFSLMIDTPGRGKEIVRRATLPVAAYDDVVRAAEAYCKRGHHVKVKGCMDQAIWETPWGDTRRYWRLVAHEIEPIPENSELIV